MKQYIIFDLEATCWDKSNKNQQINEIIEIGSVKLDEQLNQIDTFQTFVKPTKNPVLSDFCKELTSIQQSNVDTAPYLSIALYNFENWISLPLCDETHHRGIDDALNIAKIFKTVYIEWKKYRTDSHT